MGHCRRGSKIIGAHRRRRLLPLLLLLRCYCSSSLENEVVRVYGCNFWGISEGKGSFFWLLLRSWRGKSQEVKVSVSLWTLGPSLPG